MNLRHATHPELVNVVQGLTLKPLNPVDRAKVVKLRDSRSFSRKEKQEISDLATKYQYKGNVDTYTLKIP